MNSDVVIYTLQVISSSRTGHPMFKWFKKETDVQALEKELASLATKVNKHEASLSQFRSNARRYKGAVTLYSVLFYAVYLAIWAAFLARNTHARSRWMMETAPIVVVPVMIYLLRSAVASYYTQRISTEESSLEILKSSQREKIEEFKTKTNFYTTKNLIDRYSGGGDVQPASTPESKKSAIPVGGSSSSSNRKETAQHAESPLQLRGQAPRLQPQSQFTPQRMNHPAALVGTVPTPPSLSGSSIQQRQVQDMPRIAEFAPNADAHQSTSSGSGNGNGDRHWYDRMLDVIVGEDEGSEKSRYHLERTIREREETITHLELELIKLRKMAGVSASPSKDRDAETELRGTETDADAVQEGSTALEAATSIAVKTRKSKRTSKKAGNDDDEDES